MPAKSTSTFKQNAVQDISGSVHKTREEETVLQLLERLTLANTRIEARDLFRQLFANPDIGTNEGQQVARGQWKLANSVGDDVWIREARMSAMELFSPDWIDERLPLSRGSKKQSVKRKQNKVSSASAALEPCKDIRLEKNPNLPVWRSNAADSETPQPDISLPPADSLPGAECLPASPAPGRNSPSPMEVCVSDESMTAEDLKSKDAGDEDRSDESMTAEDSKSKDAGDEDESGDSSAELLLGRPEDEDYLSTITKLCPEEEEELLKLDREGIPMSPRAGQGIPNILTTSGLNALVVPEPTKLPAIKTMVFTNKNKRPSSAGPQDTEIAKKSKFDVITIEVEVVKDSSDELGARSVRMEHSSETVGTENQKVTKQCPVAGCNYILKRRVLKHIYAMHLPDLFSNRMVGKLDEAKLPQARLHALVSLIKRSLGAEVDLEQAVRKINDSGLIPAESQVDPEVSADLIRSWSGLGRSCPPVLTLTPVNSPAALLHWRCLIVLFGWLQESDKRAWRQECDELLKSPSGDQNSSERGGTSRAAETSVKAAFRPPTQAEGRPKEVSTPSCLSQNPTPIPKLRSDLDTRFAVMRGFDSHFHLDRTSYQLWGRSGGGQQWRICCVLQGQDGLVPVIR